MPTFKYGAPGLTAKQWNIAAAFDTKRFRGEHREARLDTLAGEPALFPYGTYLARVQHGAEIAEPHQDTIVTAPGMTLDEVKAELADGKRTRVRTLELDEIRDAFRDEAANIVEVEDVELLRAAPSVNTSSTTSAAPSNTAHRAQRTRSRSSQRTRRRSHPTPALERGTASPAAPPKPSRPATAARHASSSSAIDAAADRRRALTHPAEHRRTREPAASTPTRRIRPSCWDEFRARQPSHRPRSRM